jgi:hypothetical protein
MRVLLQLKTPWSDGTTHMAYDPLGSWPSWGTHSRGNRNLVLYHGVLAARTRLRPQVVPYRREVVKAREQEAQAPRLAYRRRDCAGLMRPALGSDLIACPRCEGMMMFLSCVLRHGVIGKILARAGRTD